MAAYLEDFPKAPTKEKAHGGQLTLKLNTEKAYNSVESLCHELSFIIFVLPQIEFNYLHTVTILYK